MSLPLANIVLQVVKHGNNWASLIELIVKEIAETGEMESLKEAGSQEITGGKSCCAFLVEIAIEAPQLVLPNIDHLLPCLDCDVSNKIYVNYILIIILFSKTILHFTLISNITCILDK